MKKLTNNKYANFYLNAALKLGLKTKIINEKIGLIKIFNDDFELDISSNILGVNSQISAGLATNKVKTSMLLKENNIPVPFFKTFTNPKKAIDHTIKKLNNKKHVVTKPITGSLSRGITVSPTTPQQIKKAVNEAFEGNSSIMVEEYVAGNHFRITILDNEVIAVTQRLPANVTTDGKSTINELIQKKNLERKNVKLPPIILRKKDQNFLKSKKINLLKSYPYGRNIQLQLGCDLNIGGERVRIERDDIPKENINLFIKASKTLGLRFAGIDFITPDIMTPYTQIQTAINEINSAPDSDVHYKDAYPFDNYAAERILRNIFKQRIVTKKEKLAIQPFLPNEIVSSHEIVHLN